MPASISLIVYIVEQNIEAVNNYTIQRGIGLSHIPDREPQRIHFTYFIPDPEITVDSSEESFEPLTGGALQTNAVYLIHGKFSYLVNDNSLDLVIFSHVLLPIDSAECPEAPMIAKFIGKVTSVPSVTNNGLRLLVTVSEYIRKGEKPVHEIIVTHPTTGRLSKSITAAQKNATVQFTGILFIYESILYCDVLDFSFVGIRSDDLIHSYNPWSTKDKITTKSSVAKRIQKLHNEQMSTPPTIPSLPQKKITRGKRKVIEKVSTGSIAASIIKKRQADKMDSDNNEPNKNQKN
ncbi:16858_t:CDS:1 [Acaulospora morrowiae]|uniref:16858_t:CDS:1 n=1 Tax=Acaulospora morrowiae TaxID=94023 RepID=A0A9N8WIM5_9GLOM|nr:16858_t:CDS:1 [Acaulospora morrowiae]